LGRLKKENSPPSELDCKHELVAFPGAEILPLGMLGTSAEVAGVGSVAPKPLIEKK
jgi:hypothetical protein